MITLNKYRTCGLELTLRRDGSDNCSATRLARLKRLHEINHIVIPDKYAYSSIEILKPAASTFICVMEIEGEILSSIQLADFLVKRELAAQEVSVIIGGPEGLPQEVREKADFKWSLGRLTLPHDLAQVVAAEALYRASTINAGLPYHK